MKKADELKVVYGCEACGLTWFNMYLYWCSRPISILTSSHPHTLTPYTLIPSHPHPHTLTSSHPHILILTSSYPHTLTPHTSYPHTLISSHPHTLIPSYPHTLIPSYPHTLTECITVALQKNTRRRSTLQIWVGVLSQDYGNSCHVIFTPSHPHILTSSHPHTYSLRCVQSRLDFEFSHRPKTDTCQTPSPSPPHTASHQHVRYLPGVTPFRLTILGHTPCLLTGNHSNTMVL